ncbi:putative type I restriction-modification system DNA methylase [Bergeriella denitrificans]|uniref:Putative type I restriction-modification system DNA methylase n=2 Tax=Bergeriella denitrificans TaxID=494 RepID=A0A378UFY4_BERDE|nr:putative type I restriction-modification system DNA methylase [Bergeriella denitrificans]
MQQYLPSETLAICILPDHFHWVVVLPENDHDFSRRIQNLKINFTKRLPLSLYNPQAGQTGKRESGIWQSKFWEHAIRDERDLYNHIAYTYYNPVKHGYAKSVADWPFSSFHRDVSDGLFPIDWGGAVSEEIKNLYVERP